MAVYTIIPDAELAEFVAARGLGAVLSVKGIAEGVENSNFLVKTEHGPFILTVYEKRVNAAELPFFLGLMQHLSNAGLSCPLPVEAAGCPALGTLAEKPAAMVTFLDGVWPRKPTVAQAREVGRAMAEMHLAGEDFPIGRKNGLGPGQWPALFRSFEVEADGIAVGLRAEIAGELEFLAKNWPRKLPSGVIHADLFPDNVFFLGDNLSGLIDFYFACNDLLAYDVAVCLNAWCFDAPSWGFDRIKGAALLAGYQSVRPLSAAETAALPILCRGAALRFLLTRAYDWINTPPGAMVTRKDPLEYLAKLRAHRQTAPCDYGI